MVSDMLRICWKEWASSTSWSFSPLSWCVITCLSIRWFFSIFLSVCFYLNRSLHHLFLSPCFSSPSSFPQKPTAAIRLISGTGTHTHTNASSPAPSSVFTLSLHLSPSILISPSFCLTPSEHTCLWASACVRVGPSSEALANTSRRTGGRPKQTGSSATTSFLPSTFLLPTTRFLPVHLVASSREEISHHVCVFVPPASASLGTHLSFIYNEVSSLPVPVAAQAPCFWHTLSRVCMSTCPSHSVSFQFMHLSTCRFALLPVTPFVK